MQANGTIGIKLETWVQTPDQSDTKYRTYYASSLNTIYKQIDLRYATLKCIKKARLKHFYSKQPQSYVFQLPGDVVPATNQETSLDNDIFT